MARKTVSLRRNADDVLTLKCGRSVEFISTEDKTHLQIFEQVKWASIMFGVYLSDVEATELLDKARRGA